MAAPSDQTAAAVEAADWTFGVAATGYFTQHTVDILSAGESPIDHLARGIPLPRPVAPHLLALSGRNAGNYGGTFRSDSCSRRGRLRRRAG